MTRLIEVDAMDMRDLELADEEEIEVKGERITAFYLFNDGTRYERFTNLQTGRVRWFKLTH